MCTYRQAGGLEDLRRGFCSLVPPFFPLRVSMVVRGAGGARGGAPEKKLDQKAVEKFARGEHNRHERAELVNNSSPGGSARPNRQCKKIIRGGGTRPGSFACSLQGHVCSGTLTVRTYVPGYGESWRAERTNAVGS